MRYPVTPDTAVQLRVTEPTARPLHETTGASMTKAVRFVPATVTGSVQGAAHACVGVPATSPPSTTARSAADGRLVARRFGGGRRTGRGGSLSSLLPGRRSSTDNRNAP